MERKALLSEEEEDKILKKDQLTRSVSLVPKFDEREVQTYFLMLKR